MHSYSGATQFQAWWYQVVMATPSVEVFIMLLLNNLPSGGSSSDFKCQG